MKKPVVSCFGVALAGTVLRRRLSAGRRCELAFAELACKIQRHLRLLTRVEGVTPRAVDAAPGLSLASNYTGLEAA